MTKLNINPELDLYFERIVDVPPNLVWKAWTVPEHMLPWFCPLPWKTVECDMDLRPGGKFYTVMQSPEGQKFPNMACYLEVVENTRLTWTNALAPGFRPGQSLKRNPATNVRSYCLRLALCWKNTVTAQNIPQSPSIVITHPN